MMQIFYFIFFPLLFVLSFVYSLAVFLIRLFYKFNIFSSYRAKAKVISVGNITAGGSGKTPLVEYLASRLTQNGRSVAVLLRGYKKPKSILVVNDFQSYGDEGAMLKSNLGNSVLIKASPDRVQLAKEVDSKNESDTIILDDGFQHWRIKRDLDIVTIDAASPFGNKLLLPAGYMREGLSALKRADIFCLTRCNEALEEKIADTETFLRKINPKGLIVQAMHKAESVYNLKTLDVKALGILKGVNVGLFCGIANPQSFLKTVQGLGANIVYYRFFPDHHIFSFCEVEGLVSRSTGLGAKYLITTEKDAIRLKNSDFVANIAIDVMVLKIHFTCLKGKEALDERLDSLYRN